MAHLYTVAGVVRASSQSPLNSVSACGENCARSLAPPSPTKSATLRGPQVGAVALSERDGELHSPIPLHPRQKVTPAARLSLSGGANIQH